jgi:hypothetical protein
MAKLLRMLPGLIAVSCGGPASSAATSVKFAAAPLGNEELSIPGDHVALRVEPGLEVDEHRPPHGAGE